MLNPAPPQLADSAETLTSDALTASAEHQPAASPIQAHRSLIMAVPSRNAASRMPWETIRAIFRYNLERERLPLEEETDLLRPSMEGYRDLCLARGVCRAWEEVALDLLARTVVPGIKDVDGLLAASLRASNERLLKASPAERAEIRTLVDLFPPRTDWAEVSPAAHAQFGSVLGRLHLFPNLVHLEVVDSEPLPLIRLSGSPALPKLKSLVFSSDWATLPPADVIRSSRERNLRRRALTTFLTEYVDVSALESLTLHGTDDDCAAYLKWYTAVEPTPAGLKRLVIRSETRDGAGWLRSSGAVFADLQHLEWVVGRGHRSTNHRLTTPGIYFAPLAAIQPRELVLSGPLGVALRPSGLAELRKLPAQTRTLYFKNDDPLGLADLSDYDVLLANFLAVIRNIGQMLSPADHAQLEDIWLDHVDIDTFLARSSAWTYVSADGLTMAYDVLCDLQKRNVQLRDPTGRVWQAQNLQKASLTASVAMGRRQLAQYGQFMEQAMAQVEDVKAKWALLESSVRELEEHAALCA